MILIAMWRSNAAALSFLAAPVLLSRSSLFADCFRASK